MSTQKAFRMIVLAGIFALPFLPLVVANSLFFPFITGKNFLFRIIVEVIFASWLILALYEPAYRPKFSWILGAFVWFVGIIMLADVLGVSVHKSLWSNYERMEGFVTIAHLLAYFVVAGIVLTTEKLWNAFWNTSLVAASLTLFYSLGQLAGMFAVNQGGVRVDARMGNAAYLAVYMLFHTFVALLLFVRTRNNMLRVAYAALALGFVFILVQTETRGTILGLLTAIVVTAAYIAFYERKSKRVRTISMGVLAVCVLVVALFVALRDQPFMHANSTIDRIASISLEAGETRFTIWGLAFEGFKERPLLGWGQENFNYVFNKYYTPELYGQEPWFDRVHNTFLDWLIAGGLFGLLSYLFLFLSAVYYGAFWKSAENTNTTAVLERALLLGIFSGYAVHNIFVFDNIISYMLFVGIAAMIHSRTAVDIPSLKDLSLKLRTIQTICIPVVLILLGGVVYAVNVPGLLAASNLIKGLGAPTPEARYEAFVRVLDRGGFGRQEVREQLTVSSQAIAQDASADDQIKGDFLALAEKEMRDQITETPEDIRILLFLGSFYRFEGKLPEALDILERARAISPKKPQILFEIGLLYMQGGDEERAKEVFKEVFETTPEYGSARAFYALSAIRTGDNALLKQLITPEYEQIYAESDMILNALYEKKRYADAVNLLQKRIEFSPKNLQARLLLASIQRSAGRVGDALATLERTVEDFPEFRAQVEQFMREIQAGAVQVVPQ